jgi:hypothetical protein
LSKILLPAKKLKRVILGNKVSAVVKTNNKYQKYIY